MSSRTACPPIPDADWPEALAEFRGGFLGSANVYRVMAHHPALVRAWADLRRHVVIDTSLGAEFSEIVILRAAVHLGSPYEWAHHVVRARKLGMNDARIASIRGDIGEMDEQDGVLAKAVDDLVTHKRIASGTLEELFALAGKDGAFDLIATVGFYSTLGYILNTFDTPIDDDIAHELAQHPLEAAPSKSSAENS
ncbi:carboxymuconolactone decarboxylase family protein [Marivita sp. GX14005]|uniref:carboxymuconolactone decarboxylase family protein n=1 Tax=Marivita sp. GX14005 TaxID=2942276 RepID=UPI0020192229|nr:carboxymuconolactone decarboxylase family protein [Marivita sp. GX14005]MCL3883534.1 carboxymuconolactone decarboxylase family protein [Marivita sp. GX14005]